MHARLVALDGQPNVALDRAMILLGRDQGCDVRIDSPRVSRRHCCLVLQGDVVGVRDLGSTNGTRINGRRVAIGELRRGDELAIAQFRFRLIVDRCADGTFLDADPGPGPHRLPAKTDLASSAEV